MVPPLDGTPALTLHLNLMVGLKMLVYNINLSILTDRLYQ